MKHIAIQINESEVYIQRRGLETPSENPLTIEEEIIIKLYDDLQEAKLVIDGLDKHINYLHNKR